MSEERELNLKVKATAEVAPLAAVVQANDDLLAQIKEAEELFRQHNSTTEKMRESYRQLAEEEGYAADQLTGLSKRIEESEAAAKAQSDSLEKLISEYRRAGSEAEDIEGSLGQVGEALKELGDAAKQNANIDIFAPDTAAEIKQITSETDDLLKKIEAQEKLFKGLNASSIQLRTTYKAWGRDGEHTAEQLEILGRQINENQKKELASIHTLRELIGTYKELGDEAPEIGSKFEQIEERISNAEGYINGITPAAKKAAAGMKRLGDEVQDGNQKLGRIEGTLADVEAALTSIGNKALDGLFTGIGVAVVDSIQNAGRAVLEFVDDSVEKFEQFDEAKRRIFAQAPQLSDDFRASLSDQAGQISKDLGRLSEETLPAIRKALNLNVSEDNLMTELARASGVARTEAAGFQETLVLGLSTLKAYNGAISDSTKVYDRLTFLVQNSNLELQDLPGNFNGIVSAAGEAKVSIDDVVAAMITMNQQGDDIAEIQQLLGNMFTQLQIEGTALGAAFKAAAGVGFKEYIAQGGNLVGALELLQEHADKTGDSLLNMVGGSSPFFRDVQAARAVVELTGEKLDILRQFTDQVAESDGRAATAQKEFADSTGFLRDQTEATTEVLQAQIGEALEPATRAWLKFKLAVAESIGTSIQQNQAIQEGKDQLAEVASNYVEVLEVMKAISQVEGTRGELFSADDIAKRTAIAVKLLADGFKGNEDAFRRQIELTETASQWSQTLTEQYERQTDAAKGAAEAGIEGGEKAAEALEKQAEILKALDGDTFKIALNGEITDVRLTGVDTPETAKEWLNKAGMPFGEEALKFSQDFIMDPNLQVEITSDRQTYGRAIGQIINNVGLSLDEALAQAGLALPLPVELTGDEEMTAQLKALAADAARAGRGIFEDEAVATAYLDGQIDSMKDVVAIWEEGKQKWQSFMDAFRGSRSEWEQMAELQTAVANASTPDEMAAAQEKLAAFNTDLAASYQELALQQALSNVESADALETSLAYASSIGAITEAQAEWMAQQAEVKTGLAEIDEQLKAQKLTADQAAEAFRLLTQGFVTNGTDAAAAARELEDARDPYDVLANFANTDGEGPRGAVETAVTLGEEVTTTAGLIGDMNAAALEFSTSAIDAGIEQIRVLEAAARGAAEQMAALVSASGGTGSFGGGGDAPNPGQVGATPNTPAGSANATTINHNYNIGAVTDDALYQLRDQQKRAYDRYGVSGQ